MIETKLIKNDCSCDSCNKEIKLGVIYKFLNNNGEEFNRLTLCEDCSNGMANLHYSTVSLETDLIFDNNKIFKLID